MTRWPARRRPRAGRLAASRSGRGGAQGERRPARRGSGDNFPGWERGGRREGRPQPKPPWRAEMRSSREVDPEHPPGPAPRRGGAADVERGWRHGAGALSGARGAGRAGPGQGATPAEGRALFAEREAATGGPPVHTPRQAAGPRNALRGGLLAGVACASSEVLVRECVCGRHCQG